MKTRDTAFPLLVLAALCIAFVADVLLTADHLPERLATHFGLDGNPDGWMTRSGHVRFILGFGLGVPAFILGIFAIVSRLGGAGLNIPHRDYWLAPERRAETLAFAQRKMVWLACLLVIFFAMINHLLIRANSHVPVKLSGMDLWLPIALFLAATGVWTAHFIRPFLRKA